MIGSNDIGVDAPAFRPFTRVLTVPPAWPWDQARAAKLEAQHTSPVSGEGVTILVRRLQPWALNEAGRFVAIYLRAGEAKAGQAFTIEVQGKRLRIELPSRAAQAAMLRERAWQIGAVAVILLGMAGMGAMTLQRRQAFDDHLTSVETRLSREVRLAKGTQRAKRDADLLAEADLRDKDLDHALADLRYLTANKDPNARIEAFFWNNGYWAVEAGDTAPVRDPNSGLERSSKPVRRGVWLWAAEDRPVRQ